MVIGENQGGTYCMHSRHAIFGVPGFKIRMPVKPLAVKAWFEVYPGLMNVCVAAEELFSEAVEEYGIDGTALRMSTNYGWSPGVRFNLVVNHFVFRGLTNRPLTVYGDGSNWRPFIHVRDAARAYAQAALEPESWPQQVYNVGSNDANYRIAEIAEIVREELDRELDVTYLEDEHPGPSYHVNFDRLAETGFDPEWTLRDGIQDIATELQQTTHTNT